MEEMYELEAAKLQQCVESGSDSAIIIINGYQLHGKILDFDRNVILINVDGREQMIYRHAVSTVILPKA